MSPRSRYVVVGGVALAALAVVALQRAMADPLSRTVAAHVVSATQDDEGYVRIDLQLRNEVGRHIDWLHVAKASFIRGGRPATMESLRILGTMHDGETVDAPFETVATQLPISAGETCNVRLDLRWVQEESFLDHVRDRVSRTQIELPVQVESKPAG